MHPAKVQCLQTSELINHRNSGVSGLGGLSTLFLIRSPGESNSGIPIFFEFDSLVSGDPKDGIPKLTSRAPDSRASSICCWSCSTKATCRQVRSEERRVGKEGRCRWWKGQGKKREQRRSDM